MSRFDPDQVTTLTFDCYGTLIDWEAGAIKALRPLLARHAITLSDDEIMEAFQDIESPLTRPPYRSYRAVLAKVVEGFGRRFGFPVGPSEQDTLASSVPTWTPFPDSVEVLRALARRYQLAVISNIDDDLFASSVQQLGDLFRLVVTAQQAKCYKPDSAIFELALRRLAVPPGAVVHVAEGVTEILPARRLGCATVWVRRNGRSARLLTETPDVEVPDLRTLAAALRLDV